MGPEKPKHIEPYKGLRPYEEENQDIFFGRDQEREILIDKLFSNKLTLLFAATGVGKSSLLQAAVMPELKRPERLNLDVVYYTDWVSNPLAGLKQKTIQVLRERGKVGFDYQIDEGVSLNDFFQLCSTFASEPLVVILDQFEEFFQYRRYREDFLPFVKEFSQCVMDRVTPTAFIISMREDFALELNVFKEYLPTTLFENYFRLEKLKEEKAREAIGKPVERFGFHYEEKLLDTLLKDLSEREKEAQLGAAPAVLVKDMPAYVEPPYLQIVCSRLWEEDQHYPGRKIRVESYDKMGRAKGFVDSYFNEVMNRFSLSQKKIASLAFDHLVTPRGTKMPYTAKDLSDRIKVYEKELEKVLEKLQKSRILRSQKREGVIWYELYHDIFSNIINRWNEKFKTKQRIKRASFISAMAIFALLVLFIIYDIISNTTGHYLRLSVKEKISDRIEVYKGKLKTPDIFNLHEYQAETVYQRNRVEPDKLFVEKQIGDFDRLNQELIGHLPLIARISAYWDTGEISKAFDLIKNSISENDMIRSRQVIDLLAGYGSIKSHEILKEHLEKFDNIYMRKIIIEALASMPRSLIIEDFEGLLKDKSEEVRRQVAFTLVRLGSEKAVEPLIGLLKDPNPDVQRNATDALVRLGSEKAVEPLIGLLKDPDDDVRSRAVYALGKLGSEKVVEPLIGWLKDSSSYERHYAVEALVRLGSENAVEPLIGLLKDPDPDVRRHAVSALGGLGSEKAVEPLIGLLKDPDKYVRRRVADALGRLGSQKEAVPLIGLLKDPDPYVRFNAADALGELGSEKAVEPLIGLLKDPNSSVPYSAADALVELGSEKAVEPLIGLLKDPGTKVWFHAADALEGLGSEKAVEPLIGLLKDPDKYVRRRAAHALGRLGSEKAVEPLIGLLKDPDSDVWEDAAAALGGLGSEKAVEPLIGLLKDPDSDVRRRAAAALEGLGSEKAVEPLIGLLKDPDSVVRSIAVYALGSLGSEKAIEPLIGMLKGLNSKVRHRAADALVRFGSEKAVELLIGLLKDPDPDVRSIAADALGRLGSEKAFEPLIGLLKDPVSYMRGRAADALGRLGSEKAVEPLIGLLKESYMRIRAAFALGSLGSEKAVEPLIGLLKYPNPDVQTRAADALGRLGNEKAVEPLIDLLKNPDSDLRSSAADALFRLGSEKAVEPLIGLLKYPNSDVRGRAADVLGWLGSTNAIEPLASLLNDIIPDVRKNAVLSLGKLSAREKSGVIKNLYSKKNEKPIVRLAAAAILLKWGNEIGLEYLKEISKQENVNEKIEAAGALGKATSKQGTLILIEMLDDENIRVKENVILSLGKAKAVSSLPYLHKLIQEPNTSIREAVVNALSEIAAPESSEPLKKVAVNTGERMSTRVKAIAALAKIQHKDGLQALIELLNNENNIVQYKTIMAIGKNPPSSTIPGHLLDQLKSRLKDKLKGLEKRKARWRQIRDENTEDYNQEQMDEWRSRLKEVEPREPLEFELAFSLSRIDPENEGIKLLGHHLSNVREGAWMWLGKLRDVSLIEKLYWKRKQSDIPWFIHAAYRAIDHILINIDAFGGKEELNDLEALLNKLKEKEGDKIHEGVQTRMEWTIDRLKERGIGENL